ncbi:hypothetical protein SK128_028214 [Halocaridina rubra]|uniref:Uncharacterized protein n=1 Tax=Halocaridina rubra TaxID=373956 RepID=A0AAN8ZXB0_HALRR
MKNEEYESSCCFIQFEGECGLIASLPLAEAVENSPSDFISQLSLNDDRVWFDDDRQTIVQSTNSLCLNGGILLQATAALEAKEPHSKTRNWCSRQSFDDHRCARNNHR